MRWSVSFKLQSYYRVLPTISPLICFTTMSVIRNFSHTAYNAALGKSHSDIKPHHTAARRLPPHSGLKESLPNTPTPFSPFLFFLRYSGLMLLNLELQALCSSKPSHFLAESTHSCYEASSTLTQRSCMGNGLQKVSRATSKEGSPTKYRMSSSVIPLSCNTPHNSCAACMP